MAGVSVELRRIAETHRMMKPVTVNAMKGMVLMNHALNGIDPSLKTYYDLWIASGNEPFYDMTSMIRLGSVIETSLRDSYMKAKGHANLVALRADPTYEVGIFQRIMPWTTGPKTAQSAFTSISFDLTTAPNIDKAREVMLHRHLYAHSLGMIDDKYIDRWKVLTGEDLMPAMIQHGYPATDQCFIRPLRDVSAYIDAIEVLIRGIP